MQSSQQKQKAKKVAVGLSGGVDSSVAALLLKQQGFDVTGVYMKCWEVKEDGCAADEDKAYAVQTAIKLGIKFETLDYKKEYRKKVINYFYDEYSKGRTPNPDIVCNKEIKFGLFFDWAVENGFDYVATGHYARVKNEGVDGNKNGKAFLLKGVDPSKDQSYFLYSLTWEKLQKVLFPIGELKKSEVRKLAKNNKLPSAERPESMGICFIGEVNIREFLEKEIKHREGNVLDLNGNIIGTHDGAEFFTIGQRHGFKLNTYHGRPMYVVGKNTEKNELVVGTEKETLRKEFSVNELHWIGENPLEKSEVFECEVRIRHLGELHKAKVRAGKSTDEAPKKSGVMPEVSLSKPVFGVAPGQSCVFYLEDVVLGGGIIQ